MASRLDRISNWEVRAELARFRVGILADQCGVTERQLRRYFRAKFAMPPHSWIMLNRLRKTPQLLAEGARVKEVASKAGFSHQGNFSRHFKQYYKVSPNSLRNQR